MSRITLKYVSKQVPLPDWVVGEGISKKRKLDLALKHKGKDVPSRRGWVQDTPEMDMVCVS